MEADEDDPMTEVFAVPFTLLFKLGEAREAKSLRNEENCFFTELPRSFFAEALMMRGDEPSLATEVGVFNWISLDVDGILARLFH